MKTRFKYAVKSARDIELGRDFILPHRSWATIKEAHQAMVAFFKPGAIVEYEIREVVR